MLGFGTLKEMRDNFNAGKQAAATDAAAHAAANPTAAADAAKKGVMHRWGRAGLFKGPAKAAGIAAVLVGGVAGISMLASNMRGSRQANPSMIKDPEPEALPPVMDFSDAPPPGALGDKLAGQPLVTDGPQLQKQLARSGGTAQGIGSPG